MYICNECGLSFEQYKVVYENQGECHGVPAIEQIAVCPQCEATNFEEADECECGEAIPKGDKICKDCLKKLKKDFKAMIMDAFTAEEIDILADNIDCDDFEEARREMIN